MAMPYLDPHTCVPCSYRGQLSPIATDVLVEIRTPLIRYATQIRLAAPEDAVHDVLLGFLERGLPDDPLEVGVEALHRCWERERKRRQRHRVVF